jgi:hypothetical protein
MKPTFSEVVDKLRAAFTPEQLDALAALSLYMNGPSTNGGVDLRGLHEREIAEAVVSQGLHHA